MRATRRLIKSAVLLLALDLAAVQLVPLDRQDYARLVHSHPGKVMLVDFWATWCDACREGLPKLVALAGKLGPGKFQLITISADEPEEEAAAIAFLNKEHAPYPRYIKRTDDDQAFIDSVNKKWSGALPALFLYDATGAMVAAFIGESDPAEVESVVRKVLR